MKGHSIEIDSMEISQEILYGIREAFKNTRNFMFFIVHSYNQSTFQRSVHQGRCTSPGSASILLSHLCSNLLTIL